MLFVNKQEERDKLLVLEGGSAVLSAVVSKEQADVTWLCPRQLAVPSERCQLRCDGRVHSLVLSNVAKEDAGVYTCLSPDDQMQFDISVRGEHWWLWGAQRGARGTCTLMAVCAELQVKFLRGLSDVRARRGETVVLWCELCKAHGDVVWLKDGRVLEPDARREVRVQGRERSLVLSCVGPEDAGEYCCESNDDRTLATLTVQGKYCPLGRVPQNPSAHPVPWVRALMATLSAQSGGDHCGAAEPDGAGGGRCHLQVHGVPRGRGGDVAAGWAASGAQRAAAGGQERAVPLPHREGLPAE